MYGTHCTFIYSYGANSPNGQQSGDNVQQPYFPYQGFFTLSRLLAYLGLNTDIHTYIYTPTDNFKQPAPSRSVGGILPNKGFVHRHFPSSQIETHNLFAVR